MIYSEFRQASDSFAGEVTYAVIQQSRWARKQPSETTELIHLPTVKMEALEGIHHLGESCGILTQYSFRKYPVCGCNSLSKRVLPSQNLWKSYLDKASETKFSPESQISNSMGTWQPLSPTPSQQRCTGNTPELLCTWAGNVHLVSAHLPQGALSEGVRRLRTHHFLQTFVATHNYSSCNNFLQLLLLNHYKISDTHPHKCKLIGLQTKICKAFYLCFSSAADFSAALLWLLWSHIGQLPCHLSLLLGKTALSHCQRGFIPSSFCSEMKFPKQCLILLS